MMLERIKPETRQKMPLKINSKFNIPKSHLQISEIFKNFQKKTQELDDFKKEIESLWEDIRKWRYLYYNVILNTYTTII